MEQRALFVQLLASLGKRVRLVCACEAHEHAVNERACEGVAVLARRHLPQRRPLQERPPLPRQVARQRLKHVRLAGEDGPQLERLAEVREQPAAGVHRRALLLLGLQPLPRRRNHGLQAVIRAIHDVEQPLHQRKRCGNSIRVGKARVCTPGEQRLLP